MTKSTITRERMEEIRDCCWMDDLGLSMDELSELARMALAAMDSSESVELPLDYLQGHKDGLEWASQLAEANHPETGDWLYDDPIELAKAIRKGPDMPPAQPVADSEPDRNPVLAYADSYRDMAKQGVESVPIWSVITDLERNIAPLYRHAQPAPVVQEVDADDNFYSWFGREWRENYQHNQYTTAAKQMLGVMAESAWKAGRRAAMLAAAPHDTPALNSVQSVDSVADRWIPVSERMPPSRHEVLVGRWWGEKPRWCCKWATYIPGHPDSQSSGWLIPGASWTPTHWMQLPAGPQEVKGE